MGAIGSRRDPEGTRRRILQAAVDEFVGGGLFGARVDRIARLAGANERMIYYYYGCKERLFVSVLEETVRDFVESMAAIDVNGLSPIDAIVRHAEKMWLYFRDTPRLVRLINNENLHEARYWRSGDVPKLVAPTRERFDHLLRQGVARGEIRAGIDPLHLFLLAASLGYYVVSNRHTLHASLMRDMASGEEHEALMRSGADMLRRYLQAEGTPTGAASAGGQGAGVGDDRKRERNASIEVEPAAETLPRVSEV
ncbi:DNA-binding transcriptional regulator, AcrR family [Chitinasiproducens palmae]|uniref:DNA-binding transcriptional regulator, AcrR family n=1 Tax=Chitinasiproducens palmae TaxID=1770053 RepID=A0A1H2PWM1_9BURK|nr:TetR/AcrR family transcriptional regulator [Chitinasiproducens palmae]SDV50951.1 DNA-binding transcriptional regulator, AcrR family [Chitinasiproducens palmae]